jgi:DNA-binding CsgD family transcriptional regulator
MKFERVTAIIGFCFSLFVIVSTIVTPTAQSSLFLSWVSKLIILITAVLFLIVFFNPEYALLFGLAFLLNGLMCIADSAITIGSLFTIAALSIGVKYGFFRRWKVFKLITISILVLASVFIKEWQYPNKTMDNLRELLLHMAFIVILYFMFKKDLANYFRQRTKKSLTITYKLSEKESVYVLGILAGKTSKEIASDNKITETTVRTTLSRAYKKMQISDAKQLVLLTSSIDFIP